MLIEQFSDFGKFEAKAKKICVGINFEELTKLDLNFLEAYKNFTVLNLRNSFSEGGEKNLNNLLVLSRKTNLIYSSQKFSKQDFKLYNGVLKKKFGESTILCLMALKQVQENYYADFERQRKGVLTAEQLLDYEQLNRVNKNMMNLEDKLADFLDLLLKLEERKIQLVDTNLINYDYDLLAAKARLLLDRTGRVLSQINEEKREIELRSTNALNKNVEFLSKMMMVLTLVGVVLTVPGSLGAFFGIPAISDITPVPIILFWVWVPTIAAALISFLYWKKLTKEQQEIKLLLPFKASIREAINLIRKFKTEIRTVIKEALKE